MFFLYVIKPLEPGLLVSQSLQSNIDKTYQIQNRTKPYLKSLVKDPTLVQPFYSKWIYDMYYIIWK